MFNFQMMPPPSSNPQASGLTADLLRKSERSRAKSSDVYYNPNKVYYAPYGSHNNSEYASQSSDTGCTSDAASFTTETTDNEDPRRFKRRNKVKQIYTETMTTRVYKEVFQKIFSSDISWTQK